MKKILFSQRLRLLVAAVLIAVIGPMFGRLPVAHAAVITVNSTADAVANNGQCTLREAIINANNNNQAGSTDCVAGSGIDTIQFNIDRAGPYIITPTSALPIISGVTTIDGTTQPGYPGTPLIQLNGASAGASVNGLEASSFLVVRGLVILNFAGNCIRLTGGSSTVELNYIGTDVTGMTDQGCAQNGIFNIAGSTVIQDNLISGNTLNGIRQNGSSGLTIEDNIIGLNATGLGTLGNGDAGILAASMDFSTIRGNLISGNGENGIDMGTGSNDNTIVGNLIGLDSSGNTAIQNAGSGVSVTGNGTNNNLIGGSTPADRNVISGNGANGLNIRFSGAAPDSNKVQGNYLGTNEAGNAAVPNAEVGISVTNATSTLIGGSNPGEGNLISGNTQNGVALSGGTPGTTLEDNLIGTDAAGTGDLGNGGSGVIVHAGSVTSQVLLNNVIAGNSGSGVSLSSGTTGVIIEGNRIGVTAGGSAMANDFEGIELFPGASAQITSNWIGNNPTGINLAGSSTTLAAGSSGNCIVGNAVGVTSDAPAPQTFEANWWGDASGPSGDGPGFGDLAVNVDFDPFLTVAPSFCISSLLPNGSFEDDTLAPALLPDFWTGSNLSLSALNDGQDCVESFDLNCSMRIVGSGSNKKLTGTLTINPVGPANTSFNLSFREKTSGLPAGGTHTMTLQITHNDGSKVTRVITLPASGSADWTSYTTGLTAAKTYKKINVIFQYSKSSGTVWLDAITLQTVPASPSNLIGTAPSFSRVHLNWTDNSDNEFRFIVEHSTDTINWTVLDSTDENITNYVHIGLTCASKHFYRVKAVNAGGSSGYTSIVKVTTQPGTCPPPPVVNLLQNPSFEDDVVTPLLVPDFWTGKKLNVNALTDSQDCLLPAIEGNCSMRLVGNAGTKKQVIQTLSGLTATEFDDLTLSFQAMTQNIAGSGLRQVQIKVYFNDGSKTTFTFDVPLPGTSNWTLYSFSANPLKAYNKVDVIFVFKSSGTLWLDEVILGIN
jgi:CSLREA domain-containing protein